MTTLRTTIRFSEATEITVHQDSYPDALIEVVEGRAKVVAHGARHKGNRKIIIEGPALIATTDSDLADTLTSAWRAVSGQIESVEEVSSFAPPAEDPATGPQRQYLRRLGYQGAFGDMTKAQASSLIDQLKGGLSASDVDDFTGPQHTW